ncbi:hypothetical protein ACLOJK_026425 [Asimina triloba]
MTCSRLPAESLEYSTTPTVTRTRQVQVRVQVHSLGIYTPPQPLPFPHLYPVFSASPFQPIPNKPPIMGNCASYQTSAGAAAKLVDSDGNLWRFAAPVKVAEVMLESPGHVVCHARHVSRTRRVSPMGADEELERGEVYLLLPMARMNSKASDEEMARIDATRRGNRRSGGGCKGSLSGGQVHCHVAGRTGFAGHRKSTCGAWSPVLETICE